MQWHHREIRPCRGIEDQSFGCLKKLGLRNLTTILEWAQEVLDLVVFTVRELMVVTLLCNVPRSRHSMWFCVALDLLPPSFFFRPVLFRALTATAQFCLVLFFLFWIYQHNTILIWHKAEKLHSSLLKVCAVAAGLSRNDQSVQQLHTFVENRTERILFLRNSFGLKDSYKAHWIKRLRKIFGLYIFVGESKKRFVFCSNSNSFSKLYLFLFLIRTPQAGCGRVPALCERW